ENAAVVPGLVVWAWLLGFGRPNRRRIVVFVTVWVVVGAAYVAVRAAVRHPFSWLEGTALMFVGESPVAVPLTAVTVSVSDWCTRWVSTSRSGHSTSHPRVWSSPWGRGWNDCRPGRSGSWWPLSSSSAAYARPGACPSGVMNLLSP